MPALRHVVFGKIFEYSWNVPRICALPKSRTVYTEAPIISKSIIEILLCFREFAYRDQNCIICVTLNVNCVELEWSKLRVESYLGHRRRVQRRVFHVNNNLINDLFVRGNSTDTKTWAHSLAERIQSDYATIGVEGKEWRWLVIQEVNKVIRIVLDDQEIVFLR